MTGSNQVRLLPIEEVAKKLSIPRKHLKPYGDYIAKVSHKLLSELKPKGKLVIVTAITPTPAGEGKTTTSIGLSMALNKLGYSSIVTLREPSLGPVFGSKGGRDGWWQVSGFTDGGHQPSLHRRHTRCGECAQPDLRHD